MSRRDDIAAVVGSAAILLAAAWLDTSVIPEAQRQEAATFDTSGLVPLMAGATIGIGAACLALGWLVARCSPLVALLCAAAGSLVALAPWLGWTLAASIDGAPPVLPEPIALAISDLAIRIQGPLNAVGIIGGAMLAGGVVAIARSARARRAPSPAAPVAGGTQPAGERP